MADIKGIISSLYPQAVFTDGEIPQFTVKNSDWHEVASALRHDERLSFDYLMTIVGMDWMENGMGCIYYLNSTEHGHTVTVKVMAEGDRKQPYINSVHDLWAIATIYEREVFDFYGIIFIDNPDMRRLFLNIDWVGYPLRKDYDNSPDTNPISIENERQTDFTDVYTLVAYGKIVF